MSSFNLVSMAVLLTLVVIKAGDIISGILVHPVVTLEKQSYIVAGVEGGAATSDADSTTGGASADVLEPIEPLLASADPANGEKIAKKCLQCHTFQKGEKSKLGPNLWNMVGQKIGAEAGFTFSKAMADHGGAWTVENLNAFLHKPRAFIQGTKMTFAGLKKAQDRADVVAYMNTLSDAPKPLK